MQKRLERGLVVFEEQRQQGQVVFKIHKRARRITFRLKILDRNNLELLDHYIPYDIENDYLMVSELINNITAYAEKNRFILHLKKIKHNPAAAQLLSDFYSKYGFVDFNDDYMVYIPEGAGVNGNRARS